MEKYKVDFREIAHFNGITISVDYLEEGLQYAQENHINQICVSSDDINTKQLINFDFLAGRDSITTFHWLVPLAKKSDIRGLYHLVKMENFRWSAGSDFNLDLSKLPSLKILNIGYHKGLEGWDGLILLNRLIIGGVKTNDLSFLHEISSLEFLRIIRGTFTSIAGIENCNQLKTLFIQNCSSLIHVKDTIKQMKNIENLLLEKCRNTDLDGIEFLGLKNLSVI